MNESRDVEPVLGNAADFPGVPDGYERLWTPHRMVYIEGAGKPANGGCVFCLAPEMADEDSLVVARGKLVYAVLNLYPYNSGHLLVCPYRHVANYDDTTEAEVAELGVFTKNAIRALREVSGAQGFNLGVNQGSISGAGIEAHLHQHVVPRWGQDSNFFPIVAHTKAMPQLLGEVRDRLRHGWPSA